MMVGQGIYDLFVDETETAARSSDPAALRDSARVNPELLDALRGFDRGTDRRGRLEDAGGPRGRRGKERHGRTSDVPPRGGARFGGGPSRADVIERLDRDGLLPAITFIFSRAGCNGAVSQLLARDVRLIPQVEGDRIRRRVEERVSALADEDLGVLGYWEFVEGLSRGFAAHHAGMLPTFREIVEELFTDGRIRAVFATETLALGINMPARTVVLERLVKFNGETHADITPAEYTQLTGRAGRRGIDIEGHAVVLHQRGVDPLAVGGLASTRTYPLRSSFRPTYNMAVNLVPQVGRETAREILETSFAQFQADRAVVGMAGTVRRNEKALEGYAEAMTCHLGDFSSYAAIRNSIRDLEKEASRARSASRRAEAELSLEKLRPGDIIKIPAGRRSGYAVVIQGNRGGKGEGASPTVLTADGQVRRLTLVDVPTPVDPVTHVSIPKAFNARNAKSRRDLAATVRVKVPHEPPPSRRARADAAGGEDERITELRRQMRAHPCHQCPEREDHARWAERWWRLRRETDGIQRKVAGRTNSVARTFDRICDLLAELGYLSADGTEVTDSGQTLRRLYTERDLLTAECLRHGVWRRLDAAGLAAAVSMLVHEPRRDEGEISPRMPNDDVSDAYTQMVRLWSELEDREQAHGLPVSTEPDGGMAWMLHRWASGQRLDIVLKDSEMAAGDFVRRCKQIVDLLGQIGDAAPQPALAATARKAVDAVLRGVVAADRLD
jgi:ATP-dependent RNA helicase HelY